MTRTIKLPDADPIKQGGKAENSPHVISLSEPKKKSIRKVTDIIDPNREHKQTRIVPEPKPRNSKKAEIIRMGAIAVAVVLLLNIIQIYPKAIQTKDATLDAAYAGVESIINIDTTDMSGAGEAFETAMYQFELAEEMVWYLTDEDSLLTKSNKHLTTATSLLNAGGALSSAGQLFANFADKMQDATEDLFSDNEEWKPSVTEALSASYDAYIEDARNELKTAKIYLDEVDADLLPEEYQDMFEMITAQMSGLNAFLDELSMNFPLILELLGDDHPQKYMILLENNSELRPGGGFIGSFLIVDLNDGYIDNMEFHDVYEYDGSFNEYIEPPVMEIEYLTCCWGLRDANYSPDYAVSAETVAWFFEREGGPTVDHVLMVDLNFVSSIIDMIGPVYVEALGGELTGDNFELVVSYIVESKLTGAESPKSILEKIIPAVKEEMTKPENMIQVVGSLIQAAQSKHFAAYSTDEDLQNFWRSLNLDGELYLPNENEDYLLVTTSGIGGNKTDRYVYQNIEHKTLISKDGSLLNKVTITRQNTWGEALKSWQMSVLEMFGFTEISDAVQSILGEGDNVAGIRIYVPKDAALVTAEGDSETEVVAYYDDDLGLYYYYATLRTPGGEESSLELTYTLPFALEMDPADDYFLYVETQPGTINTTFTKKILAPNLNAHAFYPTDEFTEGADLTYTYETDLTKPLHLGGVFSN